MKTILLSLFTVAMCLGACKKKSTTCPVGPERPLIQFLATSSLNKNEPLRQQGVPTDEIGWTFRPKVNGKLTSVVVKVPNTVIDIPVTIWDNSTKQAITTLNVTTTASDKEAVVPITPLQLVAGKQYVISMNTNNSYDYQNADQGVSYPYTVCNIDILSANYNFGFGTAFPGATMANTKFRAFVDFVFIAD